MNRLKILIVEDSEDDAALLLLHLKRAGYQVDYERVWTAETMKAALAAKDWDIVISAYRLPAFNGLEAHQILKTRGLDLPFIIVSGSIDKDVAGQSMLSGVSDYLMKDNLVRLVPAIERELHQAASRRARREAEKDLQKSEERYRELFENANDTICTTDLAGNFTSVNKKFEELTGLTPEETMQLNFTDLLSGEVAKKVSEMLTQKVSGKTETTRYELTVRAKDKTKKHIEISSRVINENGSPVGIQAIIRDITRRKKLEDNLHASEKRLQLALNAAEMGVWEWNLKTDEIYWSPECYRIFKVTDFGETFEDFRKFVHPEDIESLISEVQTAIKSQTIFKSEFRIITPGRDLIWLANNAVAEYDEDGEPDCLIGTVADITERKDLERSLLASEARFRALAENNVAGVTLCKPDGSLIYVNDAYLKIVGYSREDFEKGRLNWHELTAPKYHEADALAISQARQNGASEPYQKEYICKNKSRAPVLLVLAASAIDGSEYFVSAILDVKERLKAEKELRESEENYRALVQATSQFVWTVDADGKSDSFIQWWADLTGQTFEQANSVSWLNVIHPEDREAASRTWLSAFQDRHLFDMVYRVLTVTGEYRYFAVRGVPVFDENGEFRQWIGTFSDINERKTFQEKLRESETRLQLSQQAARVGTWEWNIEKNSIIWSDGIWMLLGLEPGEIELNYENWIKFVHPEDLEMMEAAVRKAILETEVIDTEFRIINADGQVLWLVSKGRVIRDDEGKAERILGVNIDITAKKQIEEDLHKSEEKLRQAQKLESVGRLAGGIAHDFNNMLTAINGYSELTLRRLPADSQVRGYIEEIKKAGEHSAALTQQLLAFSRRQILQPKTLDINRVISEMSVMLERLIGEDVQLKTVLDPKIGRIEADPAQISQVIMNLVVNSRDAMPQGGTITIKTKNIYLDEKYISQNIEAVSGDYVYLGVSDIGGGIEEEVLDSIFEPFYTTKEAGKGTGLGLATVYGVIRQSGGHINVHSRLGQGTTFDIFLPRIEREIPATEENTADGNVLHGNETILIVEDEHVVRKLTRQILKSFGYKTIEAKTGAEALEIYEKGRGKIDLLLTDVVLPQISGYELADELSKLYPDLKILFTSGYAEVSRTGETIFEAGKNFIHKPFEPDALALKVREILDTENAV